MTYCGVFGVEDVKNWIFGLLIVGGLFYLVYLRPVLEKKRRDLVFDNQVLGYLEGLESSGITSRCFQLDLQGYVGDRLAEAHRLPDNKCLIDYTTKDGWTYHSYTRSGNARLFALLCIAEYAKDRSLDDLVSWCESNMRQASRPACW